MKNNSFILSATLKSGMILRNRLMLDALLGRAIYTRTNDVDAALRNIPLATTSGIYHGSQLFMSDTATISRAGAVSRLDISAEHYSPNNTNGRYKNISKADYKNKLNEFDIICSDKVYFFGCGDIDQVSSLMRELPGIGAKTNMGWGEIAGIDIMPIPQDRSLLFNDEPMRVIPVEVWSGLSQNPCEHLSVFESATLPYWLHTSKTQCVAPLQNHVDLAFLRAACE